MTNLNAVSVNVNARRAREYRSWVRRQVNAPSHVQICVVPGSAAPALLGHFGHYTTRSGKPVRHPNAYRRAWGKPVYHASTIRVEVGSDWLVARRIPLDVAR